MFYIVALMSAYPGRVRSLDIARGLVMVLMAIDHVRVYAAVPAGGATPALFFTRWVTHFCAPGFVFFAGASAWLHRATLPGIPALSRFLFVRGLWLVFLELTVISFAWYFTTAWTLGAMAQVIWAIGWSMIVLAGLIYLPRWAVAGIALAMVLGHNLLDGVAAERFGALAPLWRVLHVSGPLGIVPILGLYPLVPWIGVMALGFLAGWLSATVGFAAPIALAAMALGRYGTEVFHWHAPLAGLVRPEVILALTAAAAVTFVHLRGIRFGSWFQNAATILKLALIAVLLIAGLLFRSDTQIHFEPQPGDWGARRQPVQLQNFR